MDFISSKKKAKNVFIKDSLKNVIANLGTSRDKKSYTEFDVEAYDPEQLEAQYVSDWMSGQIVDVPANDMVRNWRRFDAPDLKAEKITQLEKAEKKLKTKKSFNLAQKWARLYGGSVIVMNISQGLPEEPINLNQIKKGALKSLKVFDRRDIQIAALDLDVESENYREPLYYQIMNGSGKKIHYSRVLKFKGVEVPWRLKENNEYWDYSVLQRVNDAIKNSNIVSSAIASMAYESTVDIISVPELFEKLTQPGGKTALRTRFFEGALLKSINNMLLLDSKETYQRLQTTFSGLPDLLVKYIAIVASAADIPATRLLGQSPQGLNATGESDSENYFNRIESDQQEMFGPLLDYYDEVFVRSELGAMPEDFSYSFNALWSMSDTDKAEIEEKNSKRDKIYDEMGIVTPAMIAEKLKQNDVYDISDEYLMVLNELEESELNEQDMFQEEEKSEEDSEDSEDSEDNEDLIIE